MFQIVDLDSKRNKNREALNALKDEVSDSGERPFMTAQTFIICFCYGSSHLVS